MACPRWGGICCCRSERLSFLTRGTPYGTHLRHRSFQQQAYCRYTVPHALPLPMRCAGAANHPLSSCASDRGRRTSDGTKGGVRLSNLVRRPADLAARQWLRLRLQGATAAAVQAAVAVASLPPWAAAGRPWAEARAPKAPNSPHTTLPVWLSLALPEERL